jgi:hypothetical protein
MKELMKNELVLSLGAGVLAFVAVTFVLKQMDKNESKSNAYGCPTGQFPCGKNCVTCIATEMNTANCCDKATAIKNTRVGSFAVRR